MTDPAFDLLETALNADTRDAILWVVDENLSALDLSCIAVRSNVSAVTNRVDISDFLQGRGMIVELSDFRFDSCADGSCDAVYFRVSKEKPLVHHVINRAAKLLKPGGELVLAGCKNEGIKTYADKAADYLGGSIDNIRGRKTSQLYNIVRGGCVGAALDDKNYTGRVEVNDGNTVFVSKPGVYGWNKIDQGSRLLVSQLPAVLAEVAAKPERVADLGCGFGYLSVMASQLLDACFLATDNNVAAVELCRDNFSNHGVAGDVRAADCAKGIAERVDLVLCNPPFHQGFATESSLTDRFLRAARGLLASNGRALFVVNSFIPIEKKARACFSGVKVLVNNKRFKVVELRP